MKYNKCSLICIFFKFLINSLVSMLRNLIPKKLKRNSKNTILNPILIIQFAAKSKYFS